MLFPLRDENPSYGFPLVVLLIIALNAYVFYLQLTSPLGFADGVFRYGLIPLEVTRFTDIPPEIGFPVQVTLLTSMFLHGGILHLLGNMWFLWLFGDNCEWVMGRLGFLAYYLICGIAAGLSQIVVSPMSTVPMIGASGAIAGVMGAYLVCYPGAKVRSLFFFFFIIRIVLVPAWLFFGLWIVFQIYLGLGSFAAAGEGGVAYFAHIGGFFAGLILVRFFVKKERIIRRTARPRSAY